MNDELAVPPDVVHAESTSNADLAGVHREAVTRRFEQSSRHGADIGKGV